MKVKVIKYQGRIKTINDGEDYREGNKAYKYINGGEGQGSIKIQITVNIIENVTERIKYIIEGEGLQNIKDYHRISRILTSYKIVNYLCVILY